LLLAVHVPLYHMKGFKNPVYFVLKKEERNVPSGLCKDVLSVKFMKLFLVHRMEHHELL